MNYSEEQMIACYEAGQENMSKLRSSANNGFPGVRTRTAKEYVELITPISTLPKEIEPTEHKTAEELLNKHYPLQTIKPITKLQRLCIIDAINEALQSQPVKKPLSDSPSVTKSAEEIENKTLQKIYDALNGQAKNAMANRANRDVVDYWDNLASELKPFLASQSKQQESKEASERDKQEGDAVEFLDWVEDNPDIRFPSNDYYVSSKDLYELFLKAKHK